MDARQWIRTQLKTVCEDVLLAKPLDVITTPLITYAQVADVPTSRMYNAMEYQVDVWESSFAKALKKAQEVDGVMQAGGWAKTYQSPDSDTYVGTDLYHIVLSYEATVNRKWGAIISAQQTQ